MLSILSILVPYQQKISGLFKSWHCKQGNVYNFSSPEKITLYIEKLYNPVLIAE